MSSHDEIIISHISDSVENSCLANGLFFHHLVEYDTEHSMRMFTRLRVAKLGKQNVENRSALEEVTDSSTVVTFDSQRPTACLFVPPSFHRIFVRVCVCTTGTLPSVLWRCWLGGRKGIWPVKTEAKAWLSVWSEVQRFAYGPADAIATPSSPAPVKSIMVYLSGAGLPRLSWKKAIKRM